MPNSIRRLIHAIAVAAWYAAPILAQAPSLDVAVRGVEAGVKLALRDAQRLTATDPAKALDRLRKLLTALEGDRVLPADRRSQLIRIVKDQIRVVEAGPVATTDPSNLPLSPAAAKRAEEYATIHAGIAEAVKLAKSGDASEAERKVAELTKTYPDNLTVKTLNEVTQIAARREENHTVRKQKEQGALDELNNTDRAAVLPKNDVAFPKDFKEKTAKRQSDTAPTAEELRTLKALNSEITPQFNGSRLEDVIDYLSTITGLPILLDKASLDDLGIDYNAKITLALKRPVSARSVLRAVLAQVGLTFVARDGVVYATTQNRSREFLTTKVFSVADLVIPVDPRDPFTRNPFLNALMLMDTIVSTVDPDSWEQRGGAGIIRYYPPTFSIVVRQSAEVLAQMRGGRSAK